MAANTMPVPPHLNGHTHGHINDQTNGHTNGSHIKGSNVTAEVPVLIVGAGPTGLLLAHLLSKLQGIFWHR